MGRKQDSLTVPGRYDQIQEVCLFISAGAAEAGFSDDMLFRLELATDEACTNVIEHAYGGENEGTIRVSWRIEDNSFVIEILDQGQTFNPDDIQAPTITVRGLEASSDEDAAIADLKVGGLGLYFMRELMDGVTFEFDNSQGNKLTMRKRLPGNEKS